jgi:predicted nucleic acid-binding Zn ribbon protein
MKKIGRMLSDALGRDEVLRTARAQAVMRQWPEIVGEALAKRSKPDRYDNGTLWVSVDGSAWAQELRMMSEIILRKLRILSQDPEMFTHVRFGVRPVTDAEPVMQPLNVPDMSELNNLSMEEIIRRRLEKLANEGDA